MRVKPPPNTRPRDGKRARKKGAVPAAGEAQRTRRIPPYGDVPLVRRIRVDVAGHEHEWFDFDPDYAPPLPKGAIRGDVRKQEFCRMCHDPHYFYLDVERTCAQCGCGFVFSAVEQKHWYETLKFHFSSVATRCLTCRRKRRSQRALAAQLMAAKERARLSPERPDVQLAKEARAWLQQAGAA